MNYGVLGKSLPHTYSPRIHKAFADYEYGILERTESEVRDIFEGKEDLKGFNVTIPYKKLALSYCDEVSEAAHDAGAVNTVVKTEEGYFKGYNTDVYGFTYMLKKAGINVLTKSCLILGTGGASAACSYALKKMGAIVEFCSRTGDINYENVYTVLPNVEVIINTTPVGMYPDVDAQPIDISKFKSLCAVADIIYNPSGTKLLTEARKLGLKTAGGLTMLVAQAHKASRIFRGEISDYDNYDVPEIDEVTTELENEMRNITLVGMPGSGKTTLGRKIASVLGREFVDLDILFEQEYGIKPSAVISEKGENEFRRMETLIADKILPKSGLVISTGGGIVTREENHFLLKCNSRVIYIKRPLPTLLKQDTKNRPISKNNSIEDLLNKRAPLYEKVSDIIWDLPDFSEEDAIVDQLIKEL